MRALPIVLLVIGLLITASAAGAVDHDGEQAPEIVTSWQVTAPRTYEGPLAVQAVVDFGDPQDCEFFVRSSGLDSGQPVLHWEERDDVNGAFFSTYSAQGHVTDVAGTGQTIDTREIITSGGVWSLGSTTRREFAGELRYRMIIPHAGYWFREATGDHDSLDIRITCDRGFTVDDVAMGVEAHGYSQDSMAGGDGVWLSPTILGEAGVARADWFQADLTEPEVTFRLRSKTFTGHTDGQARLTFPQGEQVLALDGQDDDLDVVGGPGTWRLDLDRTVVGDYDDFKGVVYGMTPVEDLGQALAGLAAG